MPIQKATLNELDAFAEVFDLYRLFQKQPSDLAGARAFLKERLTNEESVGFIAYDDENPVGFVHLYPSFSSVSMKRIWVLNDLFVKETARNKGIANQLLKQAIVFAKETEANGIFLETCVDNLVAQSLYEKNGFVQESNYFYYLSV